MNGISNEYIILGKSPAIEKIRRDIALYGPMDAPVLIIGETGTGKDLEPRNLH